jgi:thiamine biosynthesis lipoprotein ApbE
VSRFSNAIVPLLSASLIAACSTRPLQRREYARFVMGVPAKIILYGPDEAAMRAAATPPFDRLLEIDRTLSDWRSDSELSELCRSIRAGWGAVTRPRPAQRLPDGAIVAARSR